MEGRITEKAEHGVHIPLYCRRCGQRGYSTKNIGDTAPTGRIFRARTLFYFGVGVECEDDSTYLRLDHDALSSKEYYNKRAAKKKVGGGPPQAEKV